MDQKFKKQIDKWYYYGEHQKIVDAILAVPENERDYDMLSQLAVAYNNTRKYKKAIEVLMKTKEEGKEHYKWYYRLGYAYEGLERFEEAKEMYKKALSLCDKKDEEWISDLKVAIKNCFAYLKDCVIVNINDIKADDFDDECIYISFSKSKKCNLSVFIYEDDDKIENYIEKIKKEIKWIEENEDKITKCMLKDDMLRVANEWTKASEEAKDEERECYIIDGEKVFLPITEKDFISSLQIESLEIVFEDEGISMSLSYACKPDYFDRHTIQIDIDEDRNIDCNGLQG